MRKTSSKQAAKNRINSKFKSTLEPICFICGCFGCDLAHLLPKSLYPEHYTNENNLVIMCRNCHNKHDNDLNFRQKQVKIYNKICEFDIIGAAKYFKIYD
jgi:5-methylcytosine-specific restriction endonuclease McrA